MNTLSVLKADYPRDGDYGPHNTEAEALTKLDQLHRLADRCPTKARVKCGVLFRLSSLWVGAHWSSYNRRWCINLVPCVTLWVTLKGGKTP